MMPNSRELVARQKCAEAELWLERARQPHYRQTGVQQALALYREVLQMEDVQLAEPYLGLAWLAFSVGQSEQAFTALNTAETIDPANLRISQLRFRLEKAIPPPRVRFQMPAQQMTRFPPVSRPTVPAASVEEDRPLPPLGPERQGCCAQGERVLALQEALKELGFSRLQLTGIYDSATCEAVQKLQFRQKLKLTGRVDAGFEQSLLKRAAQKKAAAESQTRAFKDLTVDSAFVELGAAGHQGVCSEGPEIKGLQTGLLRLGFGRMECTGRFDVHTIMAVKQFQQVQGLSPSGRVDHKTREVLDRELGLKTLESQLTERIFTYLEEQLSEPFSEALSLQVARLCERFWRQLAELAALETAQAYQAPEPLACAVVLQDVLGTRSDLGVTCSQGEPVRQLQTWLLGAGYELRETGCFDLQTFMALKTYQQAHGLMPTGLTDAPTRILLNQALEQGFRAQLRLEGLRDIFACYCEARNWAVPDEVLSWSEQLLTLASAADFEAVLKSLLPEQIVSELGPLGSPGYKVSEGPEVELLQLRLRELGEDLALTGTYDAQTQAAVRRWQGHLKLPLTGWVNAATAAALFAELPSP